MYTRILCVGKIKDSYYREIIAEICRKQKRIGNPLEIIEFPDQKIPDHLKENNRESFLQKECEKMWTKLTGKDYVIALCIEGKELTTDQHRKLVKQAMENGYDRITYIIGGSLGLPEQIKKRADLKLSFSRMTFPHQMMRMVLCEEIANL